MNHLPRKTISWNEMLLSGTILEVRRSAVYLGYIPESLSTRSFMKTVNILPQYIIILYSSKIDLVNTIGANIVFALLLCFAKREAINEENS
mmetsp:Transcript_17182/g.37590  ORF Transcript_17182/g.37590 Transcript_17182/m.37590 type:complete len:91 (-) Transcript_17182:804-1076(-)